MEEDQGQLCLGTVPNGFKLLFPFSNLAKKCSSGTTLGKQI